MPFAITDGELRSLSTLTAPYSAVSRPFGITGFRNMVSTYEAIYRSQPHVRTVISFQARQGGALEPMLMERVSDKELRHAREHPLDRLLRRPHPKWSAPKFWRYVVSDLLTFDNFLAVKTKMPGTRAPVALSRIPIPNIEPVGGDWLTAAGFRVMGSASVFTWDQVVHIAGYNPADARWGLSAMEALRRTLSEDLASGEARAQFMDRAARLSGWIGRPVDAPEWSNPARERFNASWTDRLTGDGPEAGSTPVLEEGMTFNQETFDAEAVQYMEARKLTGVEVSRTYHVHPALLGFMDAPPDDASRRALTSDVLTPLMGYIAAEFCLQLLPDFETSMDALDVFGVAFDIEGFLRGDFLAEAEATSRAVGGPWMLRNEARKRRNLGPVDGGDDLITPLNVTTGGRASPADTAPGTPGLGQAAAPLELERGFATKALEDLTPVARTWAEQHAAIVANNVERQKARFLSRHGAGYDATAAFNLERSNTELGDDLTGLALLYADVAAAPTAERFGITYDVTAAEAWLKLNATYVAQAFNAKTLEAVLDAITDGDTPLDDVGTAFEDAAGERADGFGIGRVVTIAGFAAHDAATQGGAGKKTWSVNSANSRHGALDGVTVEMGEDFDVNGNAAPWPGHPDLPVEEAAGCVCTVEFNV